VQKSDAIAIIGSTGRSTGTHVHFEVLRDGNVLNPKRYLAAP
jgi:murein DD-endopeptidase MepM/ murein hydrolase activator NlpD